MSRHFSIGLILLSLATSSFIVAMAADEPLPDLREKANKLFKEGQFKEAHEVFESLALNEKNQGEELPNDISMTVNSLRRLQQESKIDEFLGDIIDVHSENWRAYWAAAQELSSSSHHGFLVAGEFSRGNHRGGGQYVSTIERDRVQSLQWLFRAEEIKPDAVSENLAAQFYEFFARVVSTNRMGNQAWRLQKLTDIDQLPDLEEGYGYGYRGGSAQGAAVNEDGTPVYYDIPETFESALNDGERWRWLLEQEVKSSPSRRSKVEDRKSVV